MNEPISPCEIRTAERVGLSPDKVREVFDVLEFLLDNGGLWSERSTRMDRIAEATSLSSEKVAEVLDSFQEEFLKTGELSAQRIESETCLRPEYIAQMNLYAKEMDV